MAPRVTAITAIPTIRQLGLELARYIGEAGPLTAAPRLSKELEDFQRALSEPVLTIEMRVDDGTPPDDAVRWLTGTEVTLQPTEAGSPHYVSTMNSRRCRLLVSTSQQPLAFAPAQLSPPVLVWLRQPKVGAAEPIQVDDRALIIATVDANELPRECIAVSRTEPDGVLSRLFNGPNMVPAPDLLQADAAARALEACSAIASLAFEHEARGIRAKRALVQQRAGQPQGRSLATPINEWLGATKLRLQRSFTELARGIDDRFQQTLESPTAPFWVELDECLDSINAVEVEPRLKSVVTKLSIAAEEKWLQLVEAAIRKHCLADLAALRDTMRGAAVEIERAVADAGGPPIVIPFQQLTEDRLARLLEIHVRMQRRYQGEMGQRGVLEYVMMARRYQTIVFMFLSAFGLSFLRTYREFTVPMAVLLLSFGALQMVKSVRRERVENMSKEVEKVHELLRAESKRMVSEVHRAWTALVAQHCSDQVTLVVSQVEASVRDYFNRIAADGAEEKQRLQRQLQAFESAERKLLAPARGRDAVAQAVAQARGELRQLIAASIRTAVG